MVVDNAQELLTTDELDSVSDEIPEIAISSDNVCPICLDQFDVEKALPMWDCHTCNAQYHSACLNRWIFFKTLKYPTRNLNGQIIKHQITCPVCKTQPVLLKPSSTTQGAVPPHPHQPQPQPQPQPHEVAVTIRPAHRAPSGAAQTGNTEQGGGWSLSVDWSREQCCRMIGFIIISSGLICVFTLLLFNFHGVFS